MDLKNKIISVIGLGKTGVATANFLSLQGAKVSIMDNKSRDQLSELASQLLPDVKAVYKNCEPHPDSEIVVISPGVDIESSFLKVSRQNGAEIISEIELASRMNNISLIGITGTNGKSTCTSLIGEILKEGGISAVVGGNLGTPFISLLDQERVEYRVLEISSFQMEHIVHFKPFISIFLNITPDHLDRYPGMDDYIQAKMNMIQNQTNKEHIVYNDDDPLLSKKFEDVLPITHGFSILGKGETQFTMNATKIYDDAHATLIQLDQLALPGRHNLANALAAATAANILGVPNSRIAQVMSTFGGVKHRLEKVCEINGVTYYNDSKATNVDAVKVALDSFDTSIHLILGGKDKGGDF